MIDFGYQETAGASSHDYRSLYDQLEQYRHALIEVVAHGDYSDVEASLSLPDDHALRADIVRVVEALRTPELAYVFVIGIGGSSLGTEAVCQALHGTGRPRLFVIDTVSPNLLAHALALIETAISSPNEYVVNVVSKSGTTTETIFNAEVVLSAFREKFGKSADARVVVTTDDGSHLMEHARGQGFATLRIPPKVGGRFSVLSAVGLFPLALLGVSVDELHRGARGMRDLCLSDTDDNLARAQAAMLFTHYRKGKMIHNLFLFDPRLEALGRWYRQLLAESLGKKHDRSGNEKHTGIVPLVSMGSNDLHATAQLYFEGPQTMVTTFVDVRDAQDDPVIPEHRIFPHLLPMLDRTRSTEVCNAILLGTKVAYRDSGMPYSEISLDSLTPESVGALLQAFMLQVMYLGVFMDVNTFDQPGVERYKDAVRKILHAST